MSSSALKGHPSRQEPMALASLRECHAGFFLWAEDLCPALCPCSLASCAMWRLGNSLLEAWRVFMGRAAQTGVDADFFFNAITPLSVPCCTVPALALATGIPLCESWPCGDFLRQLEKRLGTNKCMLSLPCELGSRQTLGETEENPGQSNSKTLGSSTLT